MNKLLTTFKKVSYATRINWLMIISLAIAGVATAFPQYERACLIAVFVVLGVYAVVILTHHKSE